MATEQGSPKRGRGRPPKGPPPDDRHTVRLVLTGAELEQLRQAVEVLRQAGEPGLSQADLARRALVVEVQRVLGTGRRGSPGKRK
jgi:hypothetical protein